MSQPEPPAWSALLRGVLAGALDRKVQTALAAGNRPPGAAVEASMAHEIDCHNPAGVLALWRGMAGTSSAFLPGQNILAALESAPASAPPP